MKSDFLLLFIYFYFSYNIIGLYKSMSKTSHNSYKTAIKAIGKITEYRIILYFSY